MDTPTTPAPAAPIMSPTDFSLLKALMKARAASGAVDGVPSDSPCTSLPGTPPDLGEICHEDVIRGAELCEALMRAIDAGDVVSQVDGVAQSGPSMTAACGSEGSLRKGSGYLAKDAVLTDRQSARKERQSAKSRSNYRAKRSASRLKEGAAYTPRPAIEEKYLSSSPSISTGISLNDLKGNVAKTGYVGLNDKSVRLRKALGLSELVGPGSKYGFELVEWDGRTATPVYAKDGYLLAVLLGRPMNDPSWDVMAASAADELEKARVRLAVPSKDMPHGRGVYATLRDGVSLGGGPQKPSNASNSKLGAQILEELNDMDAFKRISGFTTSSMAVWAPKLHGYYRTYMDAVFKHDASLRRIFPRSVFAATTYNLGPRTVTCKHIDWANLPFGWCAITALGKYDYIAGGHLILWDLKLVVQFPPGASVLIPSALVAHSNVPIGEEESRYSFTQYTAGALFRWVDCGFQLSGKYVPWLKGKASTAYNLAEKGRWFFGLSLLPRRSTA